MGLSLLAQPKAGKRQEINEIQAMRDLSSTSRALYRTSHNVSSQRAKSGTGGVPLSARAESAARPARRRPGSAVAATMAPGVPLPCSTRNGAPHEPGSGVNPGLLRHGVGLGKAIKIKTLRLAGLSLTLPPRLKSGPHGPAASTHSRAIGALAVLP